MENRQQKLKDFNKQLEATDNKTGLCFALEWVPIQELLEQYQRLLKSIYKANVIDPNMSEQKLTQMKLILQNLQIKKKDIYKQLINKLETLRERLAAQNFIRVKSASITETNKCLHQLSELARFLLEHDLPTEATNFFLCESQFRELFTSKAVPKKDNLRSNHIESMQEQFFNPGCILGLIHSGIKNLQQYKKESNEDKNVLADVKDSIKTYFVRCRHEIDKTHSSPRQFNIYYYACKAAEAIYEEEFAKADEILKSVQDEEIKQDELQTCLALLLSENYFKLAIHYIQLDKLAEALFWLNRCMLHLEVFSATYQEIVLGATKEIEQKFVNSNKEKAKALLDSFPDLKTNFDDEKLIFTIQFGKRSESYIFRKALEKENCRYKEIDTNSFELPLAYLSEATLKKALTNIRNLREPVDKAPFIPFQLIDSLPSFIWNDPVTGENDAVATKNETLTTSQEIDNKKTTSDAEALANKTEVPTTCFAIDTKKEDEKAAKLERHLVNEKKRQEKEEEKTDVKEEKKEQKEASKDIANKAETTNDVSAEDEEKNKLKWHKNYPSITKNQTQGRLEATYKDKKTQNERKCYYHFFLDPKIKDTIASIKLADKKVREILENPNQSNDKQGVISTSDRNGNRYFKIKLSGHGQGNNVRIGGHIDDVIYDDEQNPHFAVNLCDYKPH